MFLVKDVTRKEKVGFEIDNFKYFAVKLIVPTVLSLNFIIAPVIYSILIKKKSFYD